MLNLLLLAGIFPQDGFPEEVSTDEDDDEYSSWRFRKRQKKAQEKMNLSSRGSLTEPEKKGKRQRAAVTLENHPQQSLVKRKRKKNGPIIGEAVNPKINGVTHEPPKTTEVREERVPHPSPDTSQSSSSTTITCQERRLKRRRRGCLLRLGLSVLPLRGAIMMKRRRLIRERRKIISSRAAPSRSTDMVTSPAAVRPSPAQQDFITFQKSDVPKPLYVKSSKSRGHPISTKIRCKSKKVTFSLNKNMTAEFKRTDRSLLVSPAGSSRVPFNPNQQPQHSVLKTPTPTRRPAPRARAVDFF
ncbi:LOW QUALITY PROTEIN: ribosomal RNA processing protein 1 homolog B [Rhinoderma darwinii]|uniref:LOW QUALITY PROTEIN: ribosomal RNA processing protein 1 homolog B n=1 Tax=Rhinoderma darwinii TaxID=43563 RepID=UPI003F66A65C